MREQPTHVKAVASQNPALVLTAIVLTVALTAALILALTYQKPYQPPPFEPEAVMGAPNPPESFDYGEIDAAGKFAFGIAGTLYRQEDGSLRIYFSNPETNEAYLMCEVADSGGKALYKSGLLRPGEHVVSLYPITKMKNVAVNIEVRVYALDPEHYYSMGTVTLDNILQPY